MDREVNLGQSFLAEPFIGEQSDWLHDGPDRHETLAFEGLDRNGPSVGDLTDSHQ